MDGDGGVAEKGLGRVVAISMRVEPSPILAPSSSSYHTWYMAPAVSSCSTSSSARAVPQEVHQLTR
jgi:hypothetical protein